MKGIHYTSKTNYDRILKEGLVPYEMIRPEFKPYFPKGRVMGVWIWAEPPGPLARAGNIIYQVASKGDPVVYELLVRYSEKDILRHEGRRVVTYHEGKLESFLYHAEEPALIVTKIIPPKDIKVVGEYDIVKLLNNAQETY